MKFAGRIHAVVGRNCGVTMRRPRRKHTHVRYARARHAQEPWNLAYTRRRAIPSVSKLVHTSERGQRPHTHAVSRAAMQQCSPAAGRLRLRGSHNLTILVLVLARTPPTARCRCGRTTVPSAASSLKPMGVLSMIDGTIERYDTPRASSVRESAAPHRLAKPEHGALGRLSA